MAASPTVSGETRLARARAVVARLHDAVPDVPSGLAGLTDRVLPYLFPTAGRLAFDETLRRSVAVEAPRPQKARPNAKTLAALVSLGPGGVFHLPAGPR